MARVFHTGFEGGSNIAEEQLFGVEDGGIFSSTSFYAFSTTTSTGAGHSLQLKGGGIGNNLQCFLGGTGQYFTRLRFNIASFDSGGGDWYCLSLQGSSAGAVVKITSAGVVELVNFSSGTVVSGSLATVATGAWHVLELSYVPTTGASVVRLDGVQIGTGTCETAGAGMSGYIGTTANTFSAFVDDWAVNDTTAGTGQTSFCGLGNIALLTPISDNARTGFLVGAAATTNLFAGVDNKPPIGVVFASRTATSQIYDGTSNTTDNYVANLPTYTAAGVSGTVAVVQAIASMGNSSTTSRNPVGSITVTNPTVAKASGPASGTTAAATWPTGWSTFAGAIQHAPTVALGTAPTMTYTKGVASADDSMACFMGLLVEYVPAAVISDQSFFGVL